MWLCQVRRNIGNETLTRDSRSRLRTDWGLIPPTTCNLCCVNGMPGILIGVRCNALGQYATISQCFPCSGAVIVS